MSILADQIVLDLFLQKQLKKINISINKKKNEFYDSLNTSNTVIQLILYNKLVKKINNLISALHFPKMENNFNFQWFLY